MQMTDKEKELLIALKTILDSPQFLLPDFKEFLSSKVFEIDQNQNQKLFDNAKSHSIISEFVSFTNKQKKPGKINRGLLDGVFDVTHFGHFNALRQARKLCDELVAAVSADDQVLVHKGFSNQSDVIHNRTATPNSWRLSLGKGSPCHS